MYRQSNKSISWNTIKQEQGNNDPYFISDWPRIRYALLFGTLYYLFTYEIKNSDFIICFLINSNSKLFLQKSLSTLSSWYSKYSELTYRINYSHHLDLSISLPRPDVCFVHFRLFGKTITNILFKWYGVLFFQN